MLCFILTSSLQGLCSSTAWLLNPRGTVFSPFWLLLWVYFWAEEHLQAYFRVDVITLFTGLPVCCGVTGCWNQKDSVFSVIKDSSNSTIFPVGPYLLWPTIPGWPFSAGIHQNSDTHYVKSSHRAFCGLGEAEAARQPPLAAELSPSVSPHRCSMVGASQHGCSRRVPKTIPHPLGHAKDTQLCANEEEPAQKSPPVVAQARTSISILLSIACLFFSVSSFCFGFAPLLISFLKYPGPNPSF